MSNETTKAALLRQMIEEEESALASLDDEIRIRKQVLARLRQKLEPLSQTKDEKNNEVPPALTDLSGMATPDRVVVVMREAKKPMRLSEIVHALEQHGITSDGVKGVLSNVVSALGRRSDVFVKKGRGIYGLKEWEANGYASVQEEH